MKLSEEMSLRLLNDVELIDRILANEPHLFAELIRRYNGLLYKIGRTYHYNHQDTEDLIQETNVSAFFNLNRFEKRSSYKTWITRIMFNQCYQKRQKFSFKNEIVMENSKTETGGLMFQQGVNNEEALLRKELKHIIEESLLEIPESYRIVFTLRELAGFSVSETATVLNIGESNVKIRLRRAKAMLRDRIEKVYSPEEIYEFNLIYCDRIVKNVMDRINCTLAPH